jgi:hypothetical protein
LQACRNRSGPDLALFERSDGADRRQDPTPIHTRSLTKALKTIYWTKSRLQKLLRLVVGNDREAWFAARVRALKSWLG